MGLKVVMDVVYNHTFKANQSRKSVLDRIVPGYYHRLDHQGEISTSTCCPNTASENVMMEKLIIDSILLWAKEYKIAGFRFDLMGHHMISNMQKIRAALDQLTIEEDGVAGKGIYLYGEGWDFGEVAGNARGVNAAQKNLPGTGVGSFNDRIRNAVRGGGPFYGITEQGFITGLYTDTNQSSGKPLRWEKSHLHYLSDVIRLSLVGNLAEFRFVTADGSEHAGRELKFQGAPAGYTQAPQENVIYISAHDNETLFDAIQLKAPSSASLDERVRIQNLGISLVALGQGIPFFHAGCEILRSKSLDRNSYDSGDWFNRLDFSYQHNNWGSGLPPYAHNKEHWPLMKTLLSQSKLKPGKAQILATCAHFEEMLQIRMSSPLFRLRSAAEIQKRVSFHNTGPNQVPGLIFMSIADFEEDSLDHKFDYFVVIFNADKNPHEVKFPKPVLKVFHLHPVQSRSADPLVLQAKFDLDHSAFSVPGRTTAVFASTRSGNQHP
jgi:pullulanase-type alpha-1,6-glucosidase